jgi:hypothetical protein
MIFDSKSKLTIRNLSSRVSNEMHEYDDNLEQMGQKENRNYSS